MCFSNDKQRGGLRKANRTNFRWVKYKNLNHKSRQNENEPYRNGGDYCNYPLLFPIINSAIETESESDPTFFLKMDE